MAEGFFNAMLRGYDRGLRWVFRHQPLMLAGTLALIVLTGYLYVTIPKGFIPQQDTGFIFGALQTRLDASFASVAKLENEVAAVILKDPAVSGVVGFAGAAGANPSESTARMFIQLKPFSERAGVQTGDRSAEAADRQVAGRQVLHAGRPGRHRRRPAGAGAVPIHADRQRRGGAQPLGADPAARR